MSFLERTELLLGAERLQTLSSARVILFGVGGVGSWCAESLVRSGITQLTLVDFDLIAESNINRQAPALHSTIGQSKVTVLRERLLDINPSATISAVHAAYPFAESVIAEHWGVGAEPLRAYDVVIDCIDQMDAKIDLLLSATAAGATVFSSMGAARKLDPQQIRIAEYWKVRGCPLGAAMRKRMKRAGQKPSAPILCVYSEELIEEAIGRERNAENNIKLVNGTIAHITAIFGFTLAGVVVNHLIRA